MKKIFLVFIFPALFSATAEAQNKKGSPLANTAARKAGTPTAAPSSAAGIKAMNEALSLAKAGNYEQASVRLFGLARRSDLQAQRLQIKYYLGLSLMGLKLYQIAAFQFVDVLRSGDGRFTRLAIEKLSVVADILGDDTLLNYAISKVELENLPEKNKDMIYYRLGEIQLKNAQFDQAERSFARVNAASRYSLQARFNRGRALMETKRPGEAIKVFNTILEARGNAPVTDPNKVSAQLATARAYYQAGDFDQAIEWYRNIPRDTDFWHDALFEQSWSFMRGARFRSALSNFHSLHSEYYKEFFIPESLLLRSIVYLYICKYDEMEKVLDLFDATYGPIANSIFMFLQQNKEAMSYYGELEKTISKSAGSKKNLKLSLPMNVTKHILREGDVKRAFQYLKAISNEKKRLDALPGLNQGGLASYANKVLVNRFRNTRLAIGEMTRVHMMNLRADLKDLAEQAGFIRYEMINGKKESLKKRIAGKDIQDNQINAEVKREFYVQNGYEYWPFDGEYWLDEIGNYHYLGKQSCE
jgi:tetratricopeptide (TPR) repeat protein